MLKIDGNENIQIKKIKTLYELYQLIQLIQEAIRVTMTTSTLIDHIMTGTPENVCDSGIIRTGISDHSLVFAIKKISVAKKVENTVEIRNMKKFNTKKSVEGLRQEPWKNVYFFAETQNANWEILENTIRSFRQTCMHLFNIKRLEQDKSLGLQVP